MTAVLSVVNSIPRDRIKSSLDDTLINYSSTLTDWRAKYEEVADMLAETRAELDDFHHASKELEAELENELQRTEKAQQDLKVKIARAETEKDDWKSKFMSLQTIHNTTTTSLQRELDELRQDHQRSKIQLRELEMGNDDLERNERAVSSSLADIEVKYSRALEEKILLEHELLDKANLEEECQRLKDELRDVNVEVSILKDQISAQLHDSTTSDSSPPSNMPTSVFTRVTGSSDDDIYRTRMLLDLQLSELLPSSENLPSIHTTTCAIPSHLGSVGQTAFLQPASFQPVKYNPSTSPTPSGVARSDTLPSPFNRTFNQTPINNPQTADSRTMVSCNPPSSIGSMVSSITGTTSKNKGVQMVSEMRARVRNLEQKIHTRVPRLRLGSVGSRPNTCSSSSLSSHSGGKSAVARVNTDERNDNIFTTQRWSSESQNRPAHTDGHIMKKSQADSSGWVLIMEDSPSPPRDKDKESRRVSGPPRSSVSKDGSSVMSGLYQSTVNTGIRRPQSRLSGANLTTPVTTNPMPTPSSRPATPTFLPVPTSGLYAHTSTAGLKRSTGPSGPKPYSQPKRSSLGIALPESSMTINPQQPMSILPPRSRSSTTSMSGGSVSEASPRSPAFHTNVTLRPLSKLPSSNSTSFLSKSRIGRPSSGASGGSTSEVDGFFDVLDGKNLGVHSRSGSTATSYVKNGS